MKFKEHLLNFLFKEFWSNYQKDLLDLSSKTEEFIKFVDDFKRNEKYFAKIGREVCQRELNGTRHGKYLIWPECRAEAAEKLGILNQKFSREALEAKRSWCKKMMETHGAMAGYVKKINPKTVTTFKPHKKAQRG